MNHSEEPNTIEKDDGTYAAVDIDKNIEITCNYANFGYTEEDYLFNYKSRKFNYNNDQNKL